ncbi:hypothetical protein CDL15_Pgr015020 [Punica granatum]|uniref:FBD domain-containing protein n=1 Tax=Punica granatum TaxID=22663 RepID=A0A218X159_PUNGR|nr:hypothetical protein CDL15_Pgr015020 [Punica granatum]
MIEGVSNDRSFSFIVLNPHARDLEHLNPLLRSLIAEEKVEEVWIEFMFKHKQPQRLAPELFSYKHLVVLRLGCYIDLDESTAINLQKVKELEISLSSLNQHLVDRFIQGCPLLEDLTICGPLFQGQEGRHLGHDLREEILVPGSMHLRRVTILLLEPSMVNYKIIIQASSLQSLTVSDGNILALYSLSEAARKHKELLIGECFLRSFGIRLYRLHFSFSDNQAGTTELYSDLICISIVKGLADLLRDDVPVQSDVVDLRITLAEEFKDFELIPHLLKCFPSLKRLCLLKDDYSACLEQKFDLPDRIPMCLSNRIKEIEFRDISPKMESEMKLLKYLLMHGRELKKIRFAVNLRFLDHGDENFLHNKVKKLKRASKDCNFLVDYI